MAIDPQKMAAILQRVQMARQGGAGGAPMGGTPDIPTEGPLMGNPPISELRPDGTTKGEGFFGKLPRPDNRVSTEIGIGVTIDGKEVLIPSMVPTLNKAELDELLSLPEGKIPSLAIRQKAQAHAEERMKRGLSPFASTDEEGKSIVPKE